MLDKVDVADNQAVYSVLTGEWQSTVTIQKKILVKDSSAVYRACMRLLADGKAEKQNPPSGKHMITGMSEFRRTDLGK